MFIIVEDDINVVSLLETELSETILQILLKQEQHGEILVPVTDEYDRDEEKSE